MHPDTMRRIDRHLGPPICWLLSIWRCLAGLIRPAKRGKLTDVKRILMVKPAEMGSTVLMYTALLRARELWPDCEFHFLVFAENKAAVDMLQIVPADNVITIRSTTMGAFIIDTLKGLKRARALKCDVAIDLEFFSRASGILAALSGTRSIAGFVPYAMEGMYKGSFFTHPVQYNPHIHTGSTFVAMIEALNQDADQVPLVKVEPVPKEALKLPVFTPSDEEKEVIRQIMREVNPAVDNAKRLIILNANSSELIPLRRWPLERFIELGKQLLAEDEDAFIIQTGVPTERPESESVALSLASDRVVNLVGKTTLDELLVLYSLCDLMVTNDSGPSHFASITPLPTITLFGPETPQLYGALGENKISITAGLTCSPCVSSYNHRKTVCTFNACMHAISVERVMEACRRLLGRQSAQNE